MSRWHAVAGALLVLALSTPPATAHQSDPTIATRIDAVEPALDGVTIEVRAGVADQILVVNPTPTPLTVLATGGEPFLRIVRDGVDANVASPDWYLSNSPLGAARVPPTASPTATPRWRRVANAGSWGWFDHRLHRVTRPLTDALRNGRRTVRLADWTIPFRYGDTPVTVRGHVEYRPLLGAFHTTVEHVPPGVEADALDGRVPGLFVRWRGTGTLFLEGIAGEAFALIQPGGVQVNAASETWQDDRRLRGEALDAPPSDPTSVRWRGAGTSPQLTWLDRRLAYAPGFPPDDVARARHPTTMVEWKVPAAVGGNPDYIRGTTTWQPAASTTDTKHPWPLYAAAGLAALGGLAVLRRRSRDTRAA